GVVPGAAGLTRWWVAFHDPELNQLVERAAHYNTEVRIAVARVVEARAMQGVARAALLPSLSSSNSFDRVRGGFSQGVVHVGQPGSAASSLIEPFETNAFQA